MKEAMMLFATLVLLLIAADPSAAVALAAIARMLKE